MNVYVVEDCMNSPGRIYGVFIHKGDANNYVDQINDQLEGSTTIAHVLTYPLWCDRQHLPVDTSPIDKEVTRGT